LGSDTSEKIAVIGAASMVGSRFCELFKNSQNLIKADLNGQNNIDITSALSVNEFFAKNDFDVAILFSAYTDVDGAEAQRDNKNGSCWQVNVQGLTNVVNSCQKNSKKLIFISTSFVFDGQKGPYKESDPRGGNLEKISWYGITKIKGEEIVEVLKDKYLILRIAYPYRSHFPNKDDFARQILTKFEQGSLYSMFTDQILSPTFIDDVAPAVETLLRTNSSGIFHLGSPDQTNPYDFAYELLKVYGKDPSQLKKGSLTEFMKGEGRTPRPVNSAMICDKIEKLGFKPTSWKEGIEKMHFQVKIDLSLSN